MTPDTIGLKFNASAKTVHAWRRRGAPIPNSKDRDVFDEIALAQWIVKNLGAASKSRPVARKILADAGLGKKNPIAKRTNKSKTPEELRDDYFEELQKAKDEGDEEREKVALNAYLKIDKQMRESQAHAIKLGIDSGEILSRAEVCRIIRASCYAGNACVEAVVEQIAEKLCAMESPEQIYKFLSPIILGGRLFAGMSKVIHTTGAPHVPAWYVEAMQDSADDYLQGCQIRE